MLLLANLSKHSIRFYNNELERNITEGSNRLTPWMYNIKHLLDETKSNIRFVLPGQVMLGEAKRS